MSWDLILTYSITDVKRHQSRWLVRSKDSQAMLSNITAVKRRKFCLHCNHELILQHARTHAKCIELLLELGAQRRRRQPFCSLVASGSNQNCWLPRHAPLCLQSIPWLLIVHSALHTHANGICNEYGESKSPTSVCKKIGAEFISCCSFPSEIQENLFPCIEFYRL